MDASEPLQWRLRVWTRFLAPCEDVWRAKTDAGIAHDEFRPWLDFRPDDPDGMQRAVVEGRPGRFPARLWPLGIEWVTEIVESVPGVEFVDRSRNRLFSEYEHHHVFEPTTDGCRYIDDVRFVPAPGLPSRLVARLTERLFVHRHRRAARHLPHDPQATGVSVLRRVLPDSPQD
ncbi:MAG: hypothetical protein D6798_19520 [Deltaproteobacteria bacterium]|nr:MAG: hypothetical protein D6798_19520 [Deltaproteobacteria bacterium]